MSSTSRKVLENMRVGVRFKISALWIAMLLLFAYGDIFGFLRRDVIQDVMAGEISGIEITQGFLVATSVYIAVACVMVFASLVLRPRICRSVNLVLAVLYILSIAASTVGETWAYYFLTSAAEVALLVLILWYSWTWPRLDEDGPRDDVVNP